MKPVTARKRSGTGATVNQMELRPENSEHLQLIRAYEAGSVQIGESFYASSFLLAPARSPVEWQVEQFSQINESDFAEILTLSWDVLLVGTGDQHYLPDLRLQRMLARAGRGIDFMSSRSACATYNLLALDGRAVAAAIILPLRASAVTGRQKM